jgi:hypothetical protein
VRKDTGEVMKVCILSARMDKIFKDWLNSDWPVWNELIGAI